MYFHHNNKLAWISIAKNACQTWQHVFDNLGWTKEDLFNPQVDLAQLKFFGFLRHPNTRHTMGIVEYLHRTKQQELLDNPNINKLFVSAVFDEHSYNIHSLVPSEIIQRTNWFVLDHDYYNYEQLVRNFLKQHNVDLPPVPRLNTSSARDKQLQTKINELKVKHHNSHRKLAKNFLGSDLRLYRTQILNQHIWDTK